LRAAKIPFTVHTYAHREGATNYGAEAAAALGVDPERIFKTLVTTTGSDLVVAVVPVANSLDLKALAAAVGSKKVAMAEPAAGRTQLGLRGGRHLPDRSADSTAYGDRQLGHLVRFGPGLRR
jgi:Cys-tRNA(Pro)/Cys-tRNA(Cys) deacylase